LFSELLLLFASKAITGIMQQSEAVIADKALVLESVADDFRLRIVLPVFLIGD
jgi:hypothetical protein